MTSPPLQGDGDGEVHLSRGHSSHSHKHSVPEEEMDYDPERAHVARHLSVHAKEARLKAVGGRDPNAPSKRCGHSLVPDLCEPSD